MGSRTMSLSDEASSPMDGGIRKRVCKACDRCRLKKSKCDGSSPCSRCKVDNAICVFGERKKSQDKVYPKGYVEMLENQQAQLVHGLQEMYRRSQTGEGWMGAPLKETSRGMPLTHDILERLGSLKHDGHEGLDFFEESPGDLQRRLLANGAEFMKREMSFDTNSETDKSPIFEPSRHAFPSFTNPFTGPLPPTPPIGSPHPSLVKTSSPLKQMSASATQPLVANSWQAEPSELEYMDYNLNYDSPLSDVDIQTTMAFTAQNFHDPTALAVNPSCLTMTNWQGLDDHRHRYFQGGVFT